MADQGAQFMAAQRNAELVQLVEAPLAAQNHPPPSAADEVQQLEEELQRCLDRQEFEHAAVLRDRLALLWAQKRLQRLEADLAPLIAAMEFEKAAAVRDEVVAMRRQVAGLDHVISEHVKRLQSSLEDLVRKSDFENAVKVRDQICILHQPPDFLSVPQPARSGESRIHRHQSCKITLPDCPVSATVEDIRALFPDAEDIVVLSSHEQRYQRRFLVVFPDQARAARAAKRTDVALDGKALPMRYNPSTDYEQAIHVSRCPRGFTEADIRMLYPNAELIELLVPRSNRSAPSCCLVHFRSAAEASAAAARPAPVLRDVRLRVAPADPRRSSDRAVMQPPCKRPRPS